LHGPARRSLQDWPAQVQRSLRERARQRLATRFDVKEYHDVVLRNGALPLDVLERNVDAWLAEKRSRPRARAGNARESGA